jgi:hypothetical protein
MKKLRKVAKYCLDNPYEIAYYTMTAAAIGLIVVLRKEKKAHAMCHSFARWTAANVKHVPTGTKQHIWHDGEKYWITAIED